MLESWVSRSSSSARTVHLPIVWQRESNDDDGGVRLPPVIVRRPRAGLRRQRQSRTFPPQNPMSRSRLTNYVAVQSLYTTCKM